MWMNWLWWSWWYIYFYWNRQCSCKLSLLLILILADILLWLIEVYIFNYLIGFENMQLFFYEYNDWIILVIDIVHCLYISDANKWFIMTSVYVGLIDRNILGQNHVLTNYPRRHFRRIFSIWLNKFNAIFTRLGLRSRGFWCRLQHYQIAWLGKIMGSVLIKEGTVLHMLM